MSSSDIGLEEDTLVDDPSLPVCHVLSCLARLGLCQFDIVVSEAGDSLDKQVLGAALGLFSNQVLLHFLAFVVG